MAIVGEIKLYTCTAPDNEVLKKPYLKNEKVIRNIHFKEDSSVVNPHIVLKTFEGLTKYNYVYINDFERSYFIRDMIMRTGGEVEIVCHVDGLYSFRKSLNNCIVHEARATGGKGNYIKDDLVVMNSSPVSKILALPMDKSNKWWSIGEDISYIACVPSAELWRKFKDYPIGAGVELVLWFMMNAYASEWTYTQSTSGEHTRMSSGYCDCSSLACRAWAAYSYTNSQQQVVHPFEFLCPYNQELGMNNALTSEGLFVMLRDTLTNVDGEHYLSKDIADVHPGDVIFYASTDDVRIPSGTAIRYEKVWKEPDRANHISHVACYIGNIEKIEVSGLSTIQVPKGCNTIEPTGPFSNPNVQAICRTGDDLMADAHIFKDSYCGCRGFGLLNKLADDIVNGRITI